MRKFLQFIPERDMMRKLWELSFRFLFSLFQEELKKNFSRKKKWEFFQNICFFRNWETLEVLFHLKIRPIQMLFLKLNLSFFLLSISFRKFFFDETFSWILEKKKRKRWHLSLQIFSPIFETKWSPRIPFKRYF